MPNRKPHVKSRRHFDDSSEIEVTITPINTQGRVGVTDFFELEFPYSQKMIAGIKEIPSLERYWEPKRKVWGVAAKHQAIILGLIQSIWSGQAKITFTPLSMPNSILAQQRAIVNKALGEFQEDNLDSLRLT